MDSVLLIGAESVARAGSSILSAAETMRTAVSNMDGSLDQHRRWMDDWLSRFEATIEKARSGMHWKVKEALEEIDAAFFSGDTFHDPEALKEVEEYLGRWQREITSIKEDVLSHSEDGVELVDA